MKSSNAMKVGAITISLRPFFVSVTWKIIGTAYPNFFVYEQWKESAQAARVQLATHSARLQD
jgi:hypothetical protein